MIDQLTWEQSELPALFCKAETTCAYASEVHCCSSMRMQQAASQTNLQFVLRLSSSMNIFLLTSPVTPAFCFHQVVSKESFKKEKQVCI